MNDENQSKEPSCPDQWKTGAVSTRQRDPVGQTQPIEWEKKVKYYEVTINKKIAWYEQVIAGKTQLIPLIAKRSKLSLLNKLRVIQTAILLFPTYASIV